jgi:hypothetical protein
MGGMLKKVSPVAMIMDKGDSAPPPPKQVKGGGIETPIKTPVTDEERKKKSVSLLGQGGERKVGL